MTAPSPWLTPLSSACPSCCLSRWNARGAREGGAGSGERRVASAGIADGFSLVGGVWEMVGGHGREGDTQDFFVNPIKCKIFL